MWAAMWKYLLLAIVSTTSTLGDGASRVNEVLVKLKDSKRSEKQEVFVLTEEELTDFAEVAIQSKERVGVKKLQFDLREGGFSVKALINMDDVQLTGISFRLFKAVLSGTQTLEAEGKLTTQDGKGIFEVESARLNDISVPAWLVNAIISYLGKKQPPHIDVTEPFDWPYGIREIKLMPDKVVIVR